MGSPNDDRSDVMNPNNDAHWYDQANRGGDWDDDESGGSTGWSAYHSRRDRLLERSYLNV